MSDNTISPTVEILPNCLIQDCYGCSGSFHCMYPADCRSDMSRIANSETIADLRDRVLSLEQQRDAALSRVDELELSRAEALQVLRI